MKIGKSLINKKLTEINMSPNALKQFITTSLAQSMTIGFEAEIIVPNLLDLDSRTQTRDLTKDKPFPRTTNWRDLVETWLICGNNLESNSWITYAFEQFVYHIDEFGMQKLEKYLATPAGENKLRKLIAVHHRIDDDDTITTDMNTENQYYRDAYKEFKSGFFKSRRVFAGYLNKMRIKTMKDFCEAQGVAYPYMINQWRGTLKHELLAKRFRRATGFKATNGTDYHSVVRKPGLWIFEPDTSLKDITGVGSGIELVSPPMLLPEAFAALDKFWDWALKSNITSNDTCGFHVGVSLPNHTNQPIDYLKLVLFLGENHIMRAFGRENNEYTQSIVAKIREKLSCFWIDDRAKAIESFKTNLMTLAKDAFMQDLAKLDDRHVSVNLQNKDYVEFRAVGGDYLNNKEMVISTIMKYARALALSISDEGKREYARKLYKLLTNNSNPKQDAIYFFSKYVAGEIDSSDLKYFVRQVREIRKYATSKQILNIA